MFLDISSQIKLAFYIFVGLIVGYLYYDNIVVPQKQIENLKQKLIEKSKISTEVVSNINKADANRTQKEINSVEKNKTITIHDSGIVTFN